MNVLRLKDYKQALDGVVRISTPSLPFYKATPHQVMIRHHEFLGGLKDYLDILSKYPLNKDDKIFYTQPPTYTITNRILKIYTEGIQYTTIDVLSMPPYIILTDEDSNKILVRFETFFPFTGEIKTNFNNLIVNKIDIKPLTNTGVKPLFNNTYSVMAWSFVNAWEVNFSLTFQEMLDTSILTTILPLQEGYKYTIIQRNQPSIVGDFYNNRTQVSIRTVVVNE